MGLKEQIDADLKAAMLGGDKTLATTLRGLKSAILYVEVAEGKRDEGLDDQTITAVLQKEAKKRQESVELYKQGGNQEKADAEAVEQKVIEQYLPKQMGDEELSALVDKVFAEMGEVNPQDMGRAIGRVKELSNGTADGGRIAASVKQRMQQ